MTPRQFISSCIFHGVDWGLAKVPFIGPILALPVRLVFPTMAYERVKYSALRPSVFVSIYLIGVVICAVLQAILSAHAGHLGTPDLVFGATEDPGGGPARVMFLDDAYNLFNYLVVVPLYLVAGTGYMISLFSLEARFGDIGNELGISLDESVKPLLSGTAAAGAFVLLLVLTQAGYAVDIQEKSTRLFWFHGATTRASFTYNGYAYLIINMFLAAFVIFVALLHLELFRWSQVISRGIRNYSVEDDRAGLFHDGGHRLKELLAPFTETAIWSKAFAMLLAINIFTWKASGVSGGDLVASNDIHDNSWFFRLVFALFVVIAVWLVSLPRYRVQYEVFKLRSANGVHEYFDIRMPWTIGWSVFIDVLMFAFFSTMIFGSSDMFNLFQSLVDG